jgi:filamentous hemagglutinin family protein
MKKTTQNTIPKQTRAPQIGRVTLLVGALIATGVLPPLALPTAVAAPLPFTMVPSGMPCGGCASNTPANLNFVQAGSASANYSPNGTNLTINQASQTAILNWQNFNIDKGYSVNFVQPSSTSSALNRIWDANPTTIAGSLNANGQVYLINQNGIVFANGAQVNTGALIASSLDITDSVYQKGYLANNNSVGVLAPSFGDGINGIHGFVRVDSGANLNGSRIMLFAPVVENSGSIVTAGGQAVMAAGQKVYLEASQDPNLRGVLVEVDVKNPGVADSKLNGQVQNNAAGTVTNFADIVALRGNITLAGYAVNQQGRVSATTSVSENGSIKLLARYNVAAADTATYNQSQLNAGNPYSYDIRATQTGVVTLAKSSVTQVTPETADTSTTTEGQGFNPSIVEVMGKTVDIQGSIIAPGGKVNLVAVGNISSMVGGVGQSGNGIYQEIDPSLAYSSFLNPNYMPVAATDGARVFLENGSLIDVSGSTASVSVARDILSVQLRGSQLADAPLQKNGFLWGQNVNIDIRTGSTLANYSGDEAQIGRTVAERTSIGGSVVIASTGDAVMNPDAGINISGGQINYTGAYIQTTTLISKGKVFNIATASPNLIYDGTSGDYKQTSNKWGITETFNTMSGGDTRGRWDPGYVEGKSAGSVTFLAPNAAIAGKILANTVSGINQRQPYADLTGLAANNYMSTFRMLPKGGTLTLGYNGFGAQNSVTGQYDFIINNDVVLQANAPKQTYSLSDVLASTTPITLDTNFFSANLNNLNVYTNGIAEINTGTSLTLAQGGILSLQAGQVDMLGSVRVAGGSVSLKTVQTTNSKYNAFNSNYLNDGAITVGGNISTRGTWVNDSSIFGMSDTSKAIVKNGGNITLNSGATLNLNNGVVLDASAGGWVDPSGKFQGGNGGNISLSSSKFQAGLDKIFLSSFGVDTGKGGSIKLGTGEGDVQIGGSAAIGARLLPADFFQNGGFSSYTISAGGAINADGLIQPKAQSLILKRDAALKATGTDIYSLTNSGFLPDWQRNPVNLTLNAFDLAVSENAKILVDPKASITLNAANQLNVLGTLSAPAGTINLTLSLSTSLYLPAQSIWLGVNSQLLAGGYFMQAQPNKQNLVQGQVLAGGNINITDTGYLVAQKGSLLDVSGIAANMDLQQNKAGSLVYSKSHIAGDAGSISIQSSEGVFFDGSMKAGVEAGSQAAAGSFSLTLNNNPGIAQPDPFISPFFPAISAQIKVGNGSFANQFSAIASNDKKAGQISLDALAGMALLDGVALQSSGFDQLKLKSDNSILLADQVNLQARRYLMLDTPQLMVDGVGSIAAAQVSLGNYSTILQASPKPVAGNGTLNVSGQMVDLTGNLTVSGANQLNISSAGDIRLNGILDSRTFNSKGQATLSSLTGSLQAQGNVTLQADQVYTSTLAQFKVAVEDSTGAPAGIITVQSNGSSPVSTLVLSAGSKLTLSAATLNQNGVLKAPLGMIDLAGSSNVNLGSVSITSVSAEGQTIPFGLIQGGSIWYYDLTGAGSVVAVSAPPLKIVNLTGPNVSVSKGATINLSGGGDLYANEFFAGTGGSINVLDPVKAPANTYAIIPGISGFAPYDPQAVGQYNLGNSKTTLQPGTSVYLSGGNGIQAGYYTLLPASYALLPGAYRVTAVTGYTDMQPGLGAVTLSDGSQVMAGKFSVTGTDIQAARWSGFAVASGAIVRTQAEYHDNTANAFFAAQAATNDSIAPRSPVDAGQLVVNATGTLLLGGSINTQHSSGSKGAWIDLNGPGFDIVNTAETGAAGLVELTTSVLNNLSAESLLIGGVRTQTQAGTSIQVGAGSVVVDNSGATLTGAEIILAANNAVSVKTGSGLQGNGTYSGTPQNITITSGDGALLRLSSGNQVTVTRNNSTGTQGTLTVENGASVAAQNSVLFDASQATILGGNSILNGKSLSLAAKAIDIGNGSSGATSLGLTSELLGQMQNFQDLILHSYNDINFYTQASLGGLNSQGSHLISNLVLDAKSLNDFITAGSSSIDAVKVTLANNNGAVGSTSSGSGSLLITADIIVLASGNKTIQGFDNVSLKGSQQILAQGTGNLLVTAANTNVHNLNLQGTLTGSASANQTITAALYDTAIEAPTASPVANNVIGAKLAISAKSIWDSGNINLAAGNLSLHATGTALTDGITLDSTSSTSVAGAAKNIAGQAAYAPAGSISLISDSGNLDIRAGAVVDVSGALSGGDAGSLRMTSATGVAMVAGNLKGSAAAGYLQGNFILDAASLGGTLNPLTGLNDTLTVGGFSNLRDMRIRTGNLVLEADTAGTARATAQTFKLSADAGSINVFGTVNSSGISGGNILLAAGGNVTLENGVLLDAHSTGAGQAGGKVTLETTAGVIELNNQRIDVHGDGNIGGSVLLRAPQIAVAGSLTNNEVALNNTGGTKLNVNAGASVTVEAFKRYTSATGLLGTAEVAATSVFKTDASDFAANATAIKSRLGMLADNNLHLAPGVEIYTSTSLTLSKDWDLSAWRFNDGNGGVTESGILTFRSAGNLNFGLASTKNAATGVVTYNTASLSDGFYFRPFVPGTTANPTGTPADFFTLLPKGASSWSYRLVAGADATGANVLAVNNDLIGNVTLAEGGLVAGQKEVKNARGQVVIPYKPSTTYFEMIRTGSGNIEVAAGGGLYLGNNNSMIYTAGQLSSLPSSLAANNTNQAVFTSGGGDVNIAVRGDVSAIGENGTGSAVSQLVSDWLYKQGSTNGTFATLPAWWVNFGSFGQNIGALGGGNVNISAGGNITSLSTVVPSTGYVSAPGAEATVLTGGNLNVIAGGDINSGIFYVGNGQGTINAGGMLGSSRPNLGTNSKLYTILALGQGNITVNTGGDLNLQSVLNPTMIASGPIFFTYGDASSVSLQSLNGNVLLSNDNSFYLKQQDFTQLTANVSLATSPYINAGLSNQGALTVYPASLDITALNGSINTGTTQIRLFPSYKGNLQFIAGADINFNGLLTMSDVSPSSFKPNNPLSQYNDFSSDPMSGHGFATGSLLPLHSGDLAPVIIVAGGSITGDNTVSPIYPLLTLPKAATIQAGVDIKNLSISVQNIQSTDATSLTAGRDIVFTPNATTPAASTVGITLSGPGHLVLQAGRNVDLGQSGGLLTNGNLANLYLSSQGAGITVLSGVKQGDTDTQTFINQYINPAESAIYSADLIAYVGNYGAPLNQTAAQAFATFSSLSQPLQEAFARQVLFSELKSAGRNAATSGGYQPGYEAIATLYPTGNYKGDINLYYSQIKTLRGGGINLLTPGGGVNAGLANASSSGPQKTAAQLGVVTVTGGDVNAFVNNDFLVNQSRVFTLQGGNILMWSSYGNLDAGKGSKTVSSTPPPLLVVDPKTGTFNVDATQSVVGSGIRVLLANKNVVPGSVDLYAPSGIINAGDAGIGSAGNIFLGALQVVGASNINFGGASVGVPVSVPPPVSVSLGNVQDASKAADQATQSISNTTEMASVKDFKPTFLTVEVIGLGDGSNQ